MTKDIIYQTLLIVNVCYAIYMGFLTWKDRKHNKMAIVIFIGISIIGLTLIFHLLDEKMWFTFESICRTIQLSVLN